MVHHFRDWASARRRPPGSHAEPSRAAREGLPRVRGDQLSRDCMAMLQYTLPNAPGTPHVTTLNVLLQNQCGHRRRSVESRERWISGMELTD